MTHEHPSRVRPARWARSACWARLTCLESGVPIAYAPQQATAQTDAAAMALLRQVVDAKGGLDEFKSIRTVVADAETRVLRHRIQSPRRPGPMSSYPDQFRVDATIPDPSGAGRAVEVVQTYNAGNAWIKDPRACTNRRRRCSETSRPACVATRFRC